MEAIILVGLLIGLIIIGVPVAFSLITVALFGTLVFAGGLQGIAYLPQQILGELDDYVLIAIPLFLLMAQVLLKGGIGKSLFDLATAWVGHWPGGLAIAALVACAIFSAISGSSVATAVTIGAVAIPEMIRRGYPARGVLGSVAAGGTLGILIPPSIPLILFGSTTQTSVGALFTAAIIPGIILTIIFSVYAAFYFGRTAKRIAPATWGERWSLLGNNTSGLLVPLIVIVGIYQGWFTPTEAAAVGSLLAIIVTMLVVRSLGVGGLWSALVTSVKDTAMVLFIVVGAMLFGRLLTNLRVPQDVTSLVAESGINRWMVFFSVILLLLLLGMFLEVISVILITVPILYPIIVLQLGFDVFWFAIIFVIVMEMSLLTPPVGLNLFVVQGISGYSIGEVVRGSMPYFFLMGLLVLTLIAFPGLTIMLL